MNAVQSCERIRYTRKQVARYREDVEEWKLESLETQRDCYVWEDLFHRANDLFRKFNELDCDIRQSYLKGVDFSEQLHDDMTKILRLWLATCEDLLEHVDRIENTYGSADGGDELRRNVQEVRGMLTPDDEFFGQGLVDLRDKAIDEDQAGQTEPMEPWK